MSLVGVSVRRLIVNFRVFPEDVSLEDGLALVGVVEVDLGESQKTCMKCTISITYLHIVHTVILLIT